jgi:hypothetical protein
MNNAPQHRFVDSLQRNESQPSRRMLHHGGPSDIELLLEQQRDLLYQVECDQRMTRQNQAPCLDGRRQPDTNPPLSKRSPVASSATNTQQMWYPAASTKMGVSRSDSSESPFQGRDWQPPSSLLSHERVLSATSDSRSGSIPSNELYGRFAAGDRIGSRCSAANDPFGRSNSASLALARPGPVKKTRSGGDLRSLQTCSNMITRSDRVNVPSNDRMERSYPYPIVSGPASAVSNRPDSLKKTRSNGDLRVDERRHACVTPRDNTNLALSSQSSTAEHVVLKSSETTVAGVSSLSSVQPNTASVSLARPSSMKKSRSGGDLRSHQPNSTLVTRSDFVNFPPDDQNERSRPSEQIVSDRNVPTYPVVSSPVSASSNRPKAPKKTRSNGDLRVDARRQTCATPSDSINLAPKSSSDEQVASGSSETAIACVSGLSGVPAAVPQRRSSMKKARSSGDLRADTSGNTRANHESSERASNKSEADRQDARVIYSVRDLEDIWIHKKPREPATSLSHSNDISTQKEFHDGRNVGTNSDQATASGKGIFKHLRPLFRPAARNGGQRPHRGRRVQSFRPTETGIHDETSQSNGDFSQPSQRNLCSHTSATSNFTDQSLADQASFHEANEVSGVVAGDLGALGGRCIIPAEELLIFEKVLARLKRAHVVGQTTGLASQNDSPDLFSIVEGGPEHSSGHHRPQDHSSRAYSDIPGACRDIIASPCSDHVSPPMNSNAGLMHSRYSLANVCVASSRERGLSRESRRTLGDGDDGVWGNTMNRQASLSSVTVSSGSDLQAPSFSGDMENNDRSSSSLFHGPDNVSARDIFSTGTIELFPMCHVAAYNADATILALQSGRLQLVSPGCSSCGHDLYCIDKAAYVVCPTCARATPTSQPSKHLFPGEEENSLTSCTRSVSAISDEDQRRDTLHGQAGAGLGMTRNQVAEFLNGERRKDRQRERQRAMLRKQRSDRNSKQHNRQQEQNARLLLEQQEMWEHLQQKQYEQTALQRERVCL